MNRSGAWQSDADEPLPISHSPSPISPLTVADNPTVANSPPSPTTPTNSTVADKRTQPSHQRRFSFLRRRFTFLRIGDASISSHRRRFDLSASAMRRSLRIGDASISSVSATLRFPPHRRRFDFLRAGDALPPLGAGDASPPLRAGDGEIETLRSFFSFSFILFFFFL